MRTSNLASAAGSLRSALTNLRVQWDHARQSWNDGVSRNFEETHLAPLEAECQRAIEQMEQFAGFLGKVSRDCSPERDSL